MSTYRRASLDTWSDLSSDTTNGTAEYSYTTEPEWAAEAVIHTSSGIELNFERLQSLCVSESLPPRVTIEVLPFASSAGSRVLRHEMSSEDSLETAPFPSQVRTISKLNGSKTGPWVQQSKGHDAQAHTKFTRKESIVEQEIRLQREREKELNLERQMLTQAKLSTPFEELQPETRNRDSLQVDALPAPSPIASSPAQSPAQSYALSSSPKPLATPKLTTQKSKGSMIYQLSNRTRSPSVEISDSKVTSPWYTSESPIARDIRTTKEREEALKVTRRQTSGPSLPGNKDD